MACRVLPRPMSSAIRTRPPRLIQYLARKLYWQINNGFLQPKLYYISLRLPERLSTRFWLVSYDKVSHWSVASSYSTPSFWNCMRVDFNFGSTLPQSTPPSVPSLPLPSPPTPLLDFSCEPSDRSCERNNTITGLGTRLSWTYLHFFCTISTGNKIINQTSSHPCTLWFKRTTFTTNLACYSLQHQSSMLKF